MIVWPGMYAELAGCSNFVSFHIYRDDNIRKTHPTGMVLPCQLHISTTIATTVAKVASLNMVINRR